MQYRRNFRNYSNVVQDPYEGAINTSLGSPLSVRGPDGQPMDRASIDAALQEATGSPGADLVNISSLEARSHNKIRMAGSDGFHLGVFDERKLNQKTMQEKLQLLNQTVVSGFEDDRFKSNAMQSQQQRYGALVAGVVDQAPRQSSDMQVSKKNLNQQLRQFNMTTEYGATNVDMAQKLRSNDKIPM